MVRFIQTCGLDRVKDTLLEFTSANNLGTSVDGGGTFTVQFHQLLHVKLGLLQQLDLQKNQHS